MYIQISLDENRLPSSIKEYITHFPEHNNCELCNKLNFIKIFKTKNIQINNKDIYISYNLQRTTNYFGDNTFSNGIHFVEFNDKIILETKNNAIEYYYHILPIYNSKGILLNPKMKEKDKSILLDIHPIFVEILGLFLYYNIFFEKYNYTYTRDEIKECIDDISQQCLILLLLHNAINSRYDVLYKDKYYIYNSDLILKLQDIVWYGPREIKFEANYDLSNLADINKIIYKYRDIINLNIEKIKKIIVYNLNNHSDYIYDEHKITDIYDKLLLKVPLYIEIFINNLIECLFRTNNIHNHNKNDILYNNYIKRFNYILLTNSTEYLNQSINTYNILNISDRTTNLKNPIRISQSFYYNYLFINFINDIYVLPSTMSPLIPEDVRLDTKLLNAIYFSNFTTKLENYMIKIINFNENYMYDHELQNEKKDLEQDIYKKIYNKYKPEYDTYQKNINISISEIFSKYLLHLHPLKI